MVMIICTMHCLVVQNTYGFLNIYIDILWTFLCIDLEENHTLDRWSLKKIKNPAGICSSWVDWSKLKWNNLFKATARSTFKQSNARAQEFRVDYLATVSHVLWKSIFTLLLPFLKLFLYRNQSYEAVLLPYLSCFFYLCFNKTLTLTRSFIPSNEISIEMHRFYSILKDIFFVLYSFQYINYKLFKPSMICNIFSSIVMKAINILIIFMVLLELTQY